MEQPEPLDVGEDEVEAMSICFDDSLDLDDRHVNRITLVGLLIADQEPSQSVVKKVLRVAWSNMGAVKVSKAKPNVFAITVGQEDVARRLIDGSPWFVKGYTLSVKSWPLYCSIDDIEANCAVFWVQAHGLPRNLCTAKNARALGSRIGYVLEVEDNVETGFKGFLRIRVDIDASKPIPSGFTTPCPITGKRVIRLKYEGLRDFCFRCGRLGHSRGCSFPVNHRLEGENLQYSTDMRVPSMSRASTLLFPPRRPSTRTPDVFDRNHWRFRMENELGGLYDFPDDRRTESGSTDKGVNGSANGTNLINRSHATVSSQHTSQQSVLAQDDRLTPGTDTAEPVTNRPIIPDYSRMWDPDNNGTILKNSSLTVAISGLSLEQNWCDPNNLPPWALTNHSQAQIEDFNSHRAGGSLPNASRGPTLVEINDHEATKEIKTHGEKRNVADNSK
ncbi:unnamed protein product [Prunus armeniaca]